MSPQAMRGGPHRGLTTLQIGETFRVDVGCHWRVGFPETRTTLTVGKPIIASPSRDFEAVFFFVTGASHLARNGALTGVI